jgi:hypothetical protein
MESVCCDGLHGAVNLVGEAGEKLVNEELNSFHFKLNLTYAKFESKFDLSLKKNPGECRLQSCY